MQVKTCRGGNQLVACKTVQDQVVIQDLATNERKSILLQGPMRCAVSPYFIFVTTERIGLHMFSTDGGLVCILPESMEARCVALHPCNTNILAIGFGDGTVRIWDMSTQAYVSSFKQHADGISSIRFSRDKTFLHCLG